MGQTPETFNPRGERPIPIVTIEKVTPRIAQGIILGVIAAEIGYFLYAGVERSSAEAQAEPSEGASCAPDAFFYEVQPGDNLNSLIKRTGILSWPVPVPDDILDRLNPGLSDPGIDRNILWADFDVLAFPPNERVMNFVRENDLLPFPNAPQDIRRRLEELHPGSLASIETRARALADVYFSGVPHDQRTKRDLCIFRIHRQGRNLSFNSRSGTEEFAQVLSEHELRYLEDGYIKFLFDERVSVVLPTVNRFLEVSGVRHRLPPNLKDYAVFKSAYNDVGGGLANPGSYFEIYGNYDSQSRLFNVLDRETDNVFLRDIFRLSTQTLIRPRYSQVYEDVDREFADTALDFVALPALNVQGGKLSQLVDPRLVYLHRALWEAGMDPIDAYKAIVRAAATFEGIDAIREQYGQNHIRDYPPFELLFDPAFEERDHPEAHDFYEYTRNKPNAMDYYNDLDYVRQISSRLAKR